MYIYIERSGTKVLGDAENFLLINSPTSGTGVPAYISSHSVSPLDIHNDILARISRDDMIGNNRAHRQTMWPF